MLTPAAVFMAVSADAVFGAVGAWGIAAWRPPPPPTGPAAGGRAAVAAGLLLGLLPMMSYGLLLYATLALAVLGLPGPGASFPWWRGVAVLPVLAFAAGGFAWWEAYPVLRERYWDGIASARPTSYWIWARPGLAGALRRSAARRRARRARGAWARRAPRGALLVGAAARRSCSPTCPG